MSARLLGHWSGTGWLYSNLRCHPELYLPTTKELHYFDRGFHRSLRSYQSRFKGGRQKVKGEITPGYSRLTVERIQFIKELIPAVRLVILCRNPIEQQWSTARRILSRLPDKNFDEIDDSVFYQLFKGKGGKKGAYIPGSMAKSYVTIFQNWLEVFPREQLFIGFFDDIVRQPQKLLGEIFAHLGVTPKVDWSSYPHDQVVNKNLSQPLPDNYRVFLEEMHRRDIETLCQSFGAPAAWKIARA